MLRVRGPSESVSDVGEHPRLSLTSVLASGAVTFRVVHYARGIRDTRAECGIQIDAHHQKRETPQVAR